MARPSKDTGKITETQISVEDVLRLRDSLVTGLATLQSAVIAHTNALLNGAPDSALDLLGLAKPFGNNVAGFQRALTPGFKLEGGEPKRKRTKKNTDPNAPKRPLTAYFLYLHTARPIIANDLGDKATPGEVSAEATRRWAAMPPEEKQLWREAYQKNRTDYQDRVAAYKANAQSADPSAAQLALENDAAVDEEVEEEEEAVPEEEVDEEAEVVSPPASPRSSKRRKTDKDTSNVKSGGRPSMTKETPILPPSFREPDVSVGESSARDRKKSPERSRKRSERKSRGGEDVVEKAKDEDAEKEKRGGDREKRSRRKRKSDVIDEE